MARPESWQERARDVALLVAGSLLFAVGLDCFMVPAGLAAGGITGLATVTHAVFGWPVGLQTIAANIVLLALIAKSGDRRYLVRTLGGLIVSSVLTDLLAPYLPTPAEGDLLLAALMGGAVSGAGLGLVFRSGGNTGGVDIIAQHLARKTGFGVGSITIILDMLVIAISIPVFSLKNALYAVVCMFVSGVVTDAVVDGPRTVRAAYIVSLKHDEIAHEILNTLHRGCTEFSARGMWTGEERPVLMCVLGRSEVTRLKSIVSRVDPSAIVIISEVYEAFGEGFRRMEEWSASNGE